MRASQMLVNVVRLPCLVVLTLLEPAVRWVCSVAMVLGIFASVVFEISAAGPRFPFLGMMATSLGFGIVLLCYYGLIGLLSR